MKIGMILLGSSFPPDIRVEKETAALCREGYSISLLTESKTENYEEDSNYIKNLKIIKKPINQQLKNSNNIFFKYNLFIRLIKKEYINVIKDYLHDEDPDILHVHDFKILPTVFYVLKKIKSDKPVIADLHENMPAALLAYRSEYDFLKKIKYSIKYNYFIWRKLEKKYLRKCFKIITVVPEGNERLSKYGIKPEKINVVSNTENRETFKFEKNQANQQILDKYKNQFVISYVGGIGPHRGLITVFRGLKKIINTIPDVKLLIVGAKEKDLKIIDKYIEKYDLTNSREFIEIVKWVPFKDVNSYVLASDICLVPHENFEHTQTTIPHKLFQYMICERPVLVSNCRPLKRIIGDNKAGYVFKAGNSDDFADKCIEMYNNQDDVMKKVIKGKRLTENEYSWSKDSKELLKLYNNIGR